MPLEQQRAAFELHGSAASDLLKTMLSEQTKRLISLASERAFDTVGVHEYGDSTYWKHDEQLYEEAAAELADAIFYLHISIARKYGDLPQDL